jgi:hypothetical protein
VALYGDLDKVKRMLRPAEQVSYGADLDERLTDIQQVISVAIEERTGRVFGGTAPVAPTTRLFYASGNTVLVLDPPARTVTEIRTGGLVEGVVVSGSTVLDAAYYAPTLGDERGLIYGLRLMAPVFGWSWGLSDRWGNAVAPVEVTGTWADQGDGTVPDDITYIANYLMAAKYRRDRTSATAEIGPDGSVSAVADPWKDETVKTIIKRYSLNQMVSI